MFKLDIEVRACSIEQCSPGDFITYQPGHFGFVRATSEPRFPSIFSITERRVLLCFDDFQEPFDKFRRIANYGNSFWLRGKGVCEPASHPSEAPFGSLVVDDEGALFVAYPDSRAGATRLYRLENGSSVLPDSLPVVGYFENWSVVRPRTLGLGEQVFDFNRAT